MYTSMNYSNCCSAQAGEDFRENPLNYDEPFEIYTCTKCEMECELFDEENDKVEMHEVSNIKQTSERLIQIYRAKLVGKYFDVETPITYA